MIAIDPGLHSAGWAVFSRDSVNPYPRFAGLVKPRKEYRDEELITRCIDIGAQMAEVASSYCVKKAVIEFPVYYGAGDARAGSIFKLCGCIGAIAGCLNENGVEVSTVEVPEWKGQLPKPIVIKRIQAILGPQMCAHLKLEKDMWDAVGIGLYKRGYFK